MGKINISEKFNLFTDEWTPKIIAQSNGQLVKLAKGSPAKDSKDSKASPPRAKVKERASRVRASRPTGRQGVKGPRQRRAAEAAGTVRPTAVRTEHPVRLDSPPPARRNL